MKKYSIFLTFALLVFFSCKKLSASVDSPKVEPVEELAPFNLQRAVQFDNRPIQSVYVSSHGKYYVGTLEGLDVYLPQYGEFGAIDNSFTRVITRMKEFNGRMFAINSKTDAIVSSSDGLNWRKEVQPGVPIIDYFVTPNQTIVMLTEKGMYTHSPSEDQLRYYNFGNAPLQNLYVGSVEQTDSGMLFVGNNLGLYRSQDQGKSWTKLTQKSGAFEKVNLLYTDRNNRLLAIENYTSMVSSTDDGETWNQLFDLEHDAYRLIQDHENRFYLLTSYGVYVSESNALYFHRLPLQDYTGSSYVLYNFSIWGNKVILSDGLSPDYS